MTVGLLQCNSNTSSNSEQLPRSCSKQVTILIITILIIMSQCQCINEARRQCTRQVMRFKLLYFSQVSHPLIPLSPTNFPPCCRQGHGQTTLEARELSASEAHILAARRRRGVWTFVSSQLRRKGRREMVADGAQPIGSGVQFPSFPFRRENYHILAFHITTASCKSNRRARDLGQTQAEGWEGRKTIGQNGVLTSANKSSMDKCVCGWGGAEKERGGYGDVGGRN